MSARYTFDVDGKKVYIGANVYYNNRIWLLEDIHYLSWNTDQYLTLKDLKNKNKKIDFVSPKAITAVPRKNTYN